MVMDSPSLLHAQLGHPILVKMEQLVPSLFKLSILSYESCHLGKYSRNSFPSSALQCVSSQFTLTFGDQVKLSLI